MYPAIPRVEGSDFLDIHPEQTEVSYSLVSVSILASEIKVDEGGELWLLDRTRITLDLQNAFELYRQLAWALKNWKENNQEALMKVLEDVGKVDQELSK